MTRMPLTATMLCVISTKRTRPDLGSDSHAETCFMQTDAAEYVRSHMKNANAQTQTEKSRLVHKVPHSHVVFHHPSELEVRNLL